MPKDATWIDVPLGRNLTRDKAPVNLNAGELREMKDVDAEQHRESLTMRRGHRKLFDGIADQLHVVNIEEYKRDGISRVAILTSADGIDDPDIDYYENISDGSGDWEELPGTAVHFKGKTSLISIPNEIRILGDKMRWLGNVRALDMHRFNTTNGPITANPVVDRNDMAIDRSWFNVTATPSFNDDFPYLPGLTIYYRISVLYDGGQESNLVGGDIWNYDDNGAQNFGLAVGVDVDPSLLPKRVKAIRLYRKVVGKIITITDPFNPDHFIDIKVSSGDKEWRMVASLPVYKMDASFVEWYLLPDGKYRHPTVPDNNSGFPRFYDKTLRTPYIDAAEVVPLPVAPNRRHGRIFSDRAFYWGLTDDTGVETYNRLYYSHYNGDGIHCPDIVLPANYVDFSFNIMGLVESGTHRIIVGDTGYAVGYMRGSVKDNWNIYQGKTRIGCQSEESIVETPFGAVFVGFDGIYVIHSMQYEGPFGLGIWDEIKSNPNLNIARGGYSQTGMRYYLFIPSGGEDARRVDPKFYCLDLQTKQVRELTAPSEDMLYAFGYGLDGTALFATRAGIFRSEDVDDTPDFDETPLPKIETSRFRLVGGDGFQQISDLGLDYRLVGSAKNSVTLIGYPSLTETPIGSLKAQTEGFTPFPVIATAPKDISHAVRISFEERPTEFRLDRIKVKVQPADGTYS